MKFGAIKSGILLCLLFSTLELFSQTQLSGKIMDSRGPLPGASIKIKGNNNGTTSTYDGAFQFSGLNEGKSVLLISYMGYLTKELEVSLSKSQILDLGNIILQESQKNVLNEVAISSAYKPSQARALNIKKSSLTISEVLAADAIGKLPDRNAAEAVQRLQGVTIERDMGEGRFVSVRGTPIQWSSATLNGNRMPSASGDYANRGVQMDIFPSELIEYVKLSKALTPDMDGDAIGGNVDFITKTSPYRKTLSVNLAGGYVDQSQSSTYNTSVVYGDKITDKLRFIASGVIWNRSSALDNYQMTYNFNDPVPEKSFAINQLQLRDYVADRRTLGFNTGLDYEFNPNHKIYFKGLYSQYLDQQSVRETYFNFNLKNVQLQARHADYLTDLYSLQVGGESKISKKTTANWSLNNARSSFKFDSPDQLAKKDRGYPIVNFIQPMTYGNLSADGNKYTGILPYVQSAISPDQLKLNQVIMSQNNNQERDYRGQADFNYQTTDRLSFKSGLKFVNKRKEANSKTLVWMPPSALGIPNAQPIYMNGLATEKFPYNGGFLSEIGSPYNDVIINQISNQQIDDLFTEDFRQSKGLVQVQGPNSSANLSTSYLGKENVYSAYLMGDLKLSDEVRIIGGFRNEYNEVSFSGKKVVNTSKGAEAVDLTEKNSYHAFLPMFHLKYAPSKNTILRAALTRSFARPDFDDLNPGIVINEVARTITEGNTKLKPTFSNNVDVMFEHYFGDVGLVSAGAFYKQLKNVIYDDQSLVQLNNQPYIKSNPGNLKNSWLAGFEMGISKRFTELPGFLGKFGFEGNYTYVNSEVKIPNFTNGQATSVTETTLPKQAKHNYNLILFFESNKFMARIAGNYKGKYLNTIRTSAGPEHYQWFDKNFTVDFSSSYAFSKKVRMFLELNNITNEPNRFYHGNSKRVENVSYFSFRGQAGVSINFY